MNIVTQNGSVLDVFTVNDETGAPADADSTPTIVAYLNGTLQNTWTFAVTNLGTGRYKVTGSLTGTVWNDRVHLIAVAVVKGVSTETVLDPILIDNTVHGVVTMLGAFTGNPGQETNTVNGFLLAMLSKLGSMPVGIGGTFDPASDSLEALREKLDGMSATGVVTVVSPVSADGTELTLVQGDDYKNADGRAIAFSGITGLPSDISTGVTVALKIKRRQTTAPTVISIAGTITTATGATKAVRFDVPAATTGLLEVGDRTYDFAVEFTLSSGDKITAVRGTVDVLDDAE